MSEFNNNMNYADKIMPQIKKILLDNSMNLVEIVIAPTEDDLHKATDLRILGGDVAVRVRRKGYKEAYHDITIRAKNGNSKTEIHKLREGNAKWYLYAWEGSDGYLCDWILLDIDVMRDTGLLSEDRPIKMNQDGYTGFVAYSLSELAGAGAIVAYSENNCNVMRHDGYTQQSF